MGATKIYQQKGNRGRMLVESDEFRIITPRDFVMVVEIPRQPSGELFSVLALYWIVIAANGEQGSHVDVDSPLS
jgi:hypothetical protein